MLAHAHLDPNRNPNPDRALCTSDKILLSDSFQVAKLLQEAFSLQLIYGRTDYIMLKAL
jgi:hypothetical protein